MRARWVVPIIGAPIENGFVEIAEGRIVRVGKVPTAAMFAGGPIQDLGDVAILPGLVNAHTHLEFSDLESPIGPPGRELAEWIVDVVGARRVAAERSDLVSRPLSPEAIIAQGAREAFDSGTVLIGEIATTPWPGAKLQGASSSGSTLPGTMGSRSPEIVSFAEVLGLTEERSAQRFRLAEEHAAAAPGFAGISPHAPYSTPRELISRCVDLALRTDCPLAMHVAESPAERELLQTGGGPFAEQLAGFGVDLSTMFPWRGREPVSALIEMLSRAPSAMLIHGNDLRGDEIDLVASYRSISVVFCPRTHAFFGHRRHPVAELIDAGINVGLGTDSRASNPDLQLWREVRWLLQHRQDLSPETVVQMATLGGAIAMKRDQDCGSLAPGRKAAFALVSSSAADTASLYEDFASSDASSTAFSDASSTDASSSTASSSDASSSDLSDASAHDAPHN